MTLPDPRLQAALAAASQPIRATLAAVAGRVAETLAAAQSRPGARLGERDLLATTQLELRRNLGVLQTAFAAELSVRINQDLAPRENTGKRKLAETDWASLSLVDDAEMEERMYADRIGQQISHLCDSELRELSTYMAALLRGGAEPRNPLRAENIGAALYRGIEAVTKAPEARQLLTRELGGAMARAMPECYAEVLRGLQATGLQPVSLTVRQSDGPGYKLPGINSAYATLSSTRSDAAEFDESQDDAADDGRHYGGSPGAHTGHDTRSRSGASSGSGAYSSTSGRGGMRSGFSSRSGPTSRPGLTPMQADAQMMALLRHLNASSAASSYRGEFDPGPRSGSGAPMSAPASESTPSSINSFRGGDHVAPAAYAADGLTGLMAVNLIRAHRDELRQAAGGQLDHMVIDVVGSLFDQILSDARVPPQMARQIARLQLPVLRVALNDSSFFSSRRHPVRRFVNRIASLACAFDDFDEGPGKQFLERVRALVQEIIDGDFDQVDLYSQKLAQLEAFIAEQTHEEAQEQGAVATLDAKESELRLQQRYMMQLRGALQPMALPDWLTEFLPQVWGQALVLAVSRDGVDSDRVKRYRRVGRDLVMSIMPKGSPALRKKFLMALPPLMKDLNEGLALVGWPEAAQREFFAKLLPAHAASLKGAAQSELDHNLMAKQLEAIFNSPVPTNDAASAADPVPDVAPEVVEQRFSPEEVQRVGLVSESTVDWTGNVDIDVTIDDEPARAEASTQPGELAESSPAGLPSGDVDLDITQPDAIDPNDPPEPSRGPQLFDHIKLGFAYQMHLKDEWQKVRLTHVSAGRSFFVFTRGRKHQETISMTARMLARMCETGRMRAVESAYLMERATHRARKQLAALRTKY